MDPLHEIILKFSRDRVLAHEVLFAHRHPDETPDYIKGMIRTWHSPAKWELFMVFRGGAKSTVSEEAILLKAAFREIKNYLIVGSIIDRAEERLHAIRHEIEQNEQLFEVFGDLKGPTWGDGELVLSNGVRLLAVGKRQSLRGVKFLDARPDGFFADDLEDKSDIRTPESRDAILSWFISDLIPACDITKVHGRCAATPLHPEALPYQIERMGWNVHRFPVEYLDEKGRRTPTWPARVPLMEVDKIKASFARAGKVQDYNNEYMCVAEDPGEKRFKTDMFRVEAQVRTWQNVYCMFDPARTVNNNSATTGYAAWSWIGNRLVVWDAWGKLLMPDEIVSEVFKAHDDYRPAIIGVEEDGLNEWLLQPIRQEQIKRGQTIPYKAVRAPKGKNDFIMGLQPFFNAREIWFAQDLPDLKSQLLSFPSGRIDVPNALAYALKMRPGAPIYEDFGGRNVSEDMSPTSGRPAWLCLNATPSMTTGILLQIIDGALRIYADWVREGDPGQVLSDIVKEANTETGRQVRLIAGAQHFERYTNYGLKQAVQRLGMELRRGVGLSAGQAVIRELLKREIRGMPALMIDRNAGWTANGMAGGYARALLKQGILADYAEEGPYRVLIEGLEAFAGLQKTGSPDDEDDGIAYDRTPGGRLFVTARR